MKKENTTYHKGSIFESRVSKLIGAKKTVASGSTRFSGGDLQTKDFLIECKTKITKSENITIKKQWLDKINKQAFEQGKAYSALTFSFDYETGEPYFIINASLFKYLLEYLEE